MSDKSAFEIFTISKREAAIILRRFHYLSNISRGFKSGHNFGLFKEGKLVGVAIFTGLPVPELVTGMFGLDRNEQLGMFELSRLCLEPETQRSEHNLASWFLSRCIKRLRRENEVRAILSYADSAFHNGIVYAACNFKYYGLTDAKNDFYIRNGDGTFIKHNRGSIRGIDGEWRERTRKHRFVMIFDNLLHMRWEERKWVNEQQARDGHSGCLSAHPCADELLPQEVREVGSSQVRRAFADSREPAPEAEGRYAQRMEGSSEYDRRFTQGRLGFES